MKLIWAGPARLDLLELTAYYRRIDPLLSVQMRQRIEAEARKMLATPTIAPKVSKRGLRKWRVKGTPYALLFIINDNRLEIEAVVHQARDFRPG